MSRCRVERLEEQVSAATEESTLLDGSLRQLAGPVGLIANEVVWPERLTVRGRRILERGRDLIVRLRSLDGEPLLKCNDSDPLDARFRATVAMTDTALRIVQAFPDAPECAVAAVRGARGNPGRRRRPHCRHWWPRWTSAAGKAAGSKTWPTC